MYDCLHTAEGPQTYTRGVMVAGEMAWQGRRAYASATAVRGLQGLQALSPRHWPPLGAFIKLPALRVVHDCKGCITSWYWGILRLLSELSQRFLWYECTV